MAQRAGRAPSSKFQQINHSDGIRCFDGCLLFPTIRSEMLQVFFLFQRVQSIQTATGLDSVGCPLWFDECIYYFSGNINTFLPTSYLGFSLFWSSIFQLFRPVTSRPFAIFSDSIFNPASTSAVCDASHLTVGAVDSAACTLVKDGWVSPLHLSWLDECCYALMAVLPLIVMHKTHLNAVVEGQLGVLFLFWFYYFCCFSQNQFSS